MVSDTIHDKFIDKRNKLVREYLKEKKGMSDTNIAYFLKEFDTLTEAEKSEVIYEMVGKEIYKTCPVSIDTFVEDQYFLGSIFDNVFKIWRDLFREVYPGNGPFCKQYDQIVLSCGTRCFGKGTKILMYDNSTKKVENIKVGDTVMGDDSTPRVVIDITHGKEQMYKVIPYNDEDNFIVCNAHHILPVYSSDGSFIKVEVEKEYNDRRKYGTLEIKKYSFLKQEREYPIYRSFKIEQLVEDDYYGFTLDRNHLFKLASGYIQHNCGKTYATAIVLLYEIYILTTMINPTKAFSVSNIVFAILSKDNSAAVSQIGSLIFQGLTQSPYFKSVVREKLSFSKVDKEGVQITDDILLRAGSSLSVLIGANIHSACLDEANQPSPRIAAENLIDVRMKMYQEMRDRREASFSKAPKRTGMLMFTSSPTDEGDVLSEIIADVKKNDIPGVLIRDNIARWEAREEDMDETFELFLGSDTKDPCILDGSIELKPQEWERVIKIPAKADYYAQFQTDPYLAIQNIAGRRTMPETALFNTVSVFERVFKKENYIFTTDTPVVTVGSSLNLDSFLKIPDYFSHPDRPDCYRYIHLDMAYKCDRFGLTSVYSDRVKYVSEEDGHEILRRKYFVDFCLGIESRNKEAVDILKILEFVYSLKEKGYPLKLVTTDNHQGEIARQMIAKRGVKTEYLSMEKSKEQYLNLKNIILTESLEGFINPTLTRELRGLRESQKKIEKGKGYTDDMSDSLAGALWSCSQDKFFKRNNEAISEIIQQTSIGHTRVANNSSVNRNPNVGFSGLASRMRQGKMILDKGNLGFGYRRPR